MPLAGGTEVAVALGSNLGDRRGYLAFAVDRLRGLLDDIRVSPFFDTTPVGVGFQPRFLNGAVVGLARHAPGVLLDTLQSIELEAGRARPHSGAARTLDLDLILYGDLVLEEPGLVVPHPRFRERRFVLEPLARIAPGLVDPVTGLSVRELLDRLGPGTP